MGLELHRSFPWIDYICPGEADYTFPALVRRLADGAPADDLPGVIARRDGESHVGPTPPVIHDMDALPDPDYDDYFGELARMPFGAEIPVSLLIESARGCWWGAKSHCTFCGLNGSSMAFRAKGSDRVYDELQRQKARYGIGRFLAVDNIMSFGYFKDLLPRLKAEPLGVSLFYEIKSNLKREQVRMLREAGVLSLQPGVESLNTHVLRLMGKGVSAIQNVQLLKFCREFGIEVAWNLLFGFPGETAEDYAETARLMETIYHLRAPGAVAAIRLDRFSPNFDRADTFGLVNVRPFALYSYLYPLPPERVANLAYFFEYAYADGRAPETYVEETLRKVEVWRANVEGDLLMDDVAAGLRVTDTRPGREPRQFVLDGLQRRVYEFCNEIRTRDRIHTFAAQVAGASSTPAAVDACLDDLVRWDLMLQEGQQFLSLAVRPIIVETTPTLLQAAGF